MPPFKDHFSALAETYARYRPSYPGPLFDWLTSVCPARRLAWDCATGNGQAAIELAIRFEHVVATDGSAEQVAKARPHPQIEYRVALAETSGLAARSVDLVTVAQAIHWLDRDRFFTEVGRVLRPAGIVAMWGYNLLRVTPQVDAIVRRFYEVTVGPWWTPERRLVDDEYASLEFPFATIPMPDFTMTADWTLPHLVGYLRSWSAVRRYRTDRGQDPVAEIVPQLAAAWDDPDRPRLVRWPLFGRVGRVPRV